MPEPPLTMVEGQTVGGLRRAGKRIAIGLQNGLWIVVHLLIAVVARRRSDLPEDRGAYRAEATATEAATVTAEESAVPRGNSRTR